MTSTDEFVTNDERDDPMTDTAIETKNDFLVGVQGNKILVMLAGINMDKPAALRMAAWLVALADDRDEFPAVLAAVQNT